MSRRNLGYHFNQVVNVHHDIHLWYWYCIPI